MNAHKYSTWEAEYGDLGCSQTSSQRVTLEVTPSTDCSVGPCVALEWNGEVPSHLSIIQC